MSFMLSSRPANEPISADNTVVYQKGNASEEELKATALTVLIQLGEGDVLISTTKVEGNGEITPALVFRPMPEGWKPKTGVAEQMEGSSAEGIAVFLRFKNVEAVEAQERRLSKMKEELLALEDQGEIAAISVKASRTPNEQGFFTAVARSHGERGASYRAEARSRKLAGLLALRMLEEDLKEEAHAERWGV